MRIACIFAALQTEVHVIDGRNDILPFLDREIARALTTAMERSVIIFHWNTCVKAASRPDGNVSA